MLTKIFYLKNYFKKSSKKSQIKNIDFTGFFNKKYNFQKKLKNKVKFLDYKKETLNKKIEISFFNYKKIKHNSQNSSLKNPFTPIWLKNESYFNLNDLTFLIKKELLLTQLLKKKQFFFVLKDLTLGLNQSILSLLKNNNPFQKKLLNTKAYFLVENKKFYLFYHKYLSTTFFSTGDFNKSSLCKTNNLYPVLLQKLFPIYSTSLYIKSLNPSYNVYVKKNEIASFFWALTFINRKWDFAKKNCGNRNFSQNKFLKHLKIKSFLNGHNLLNPNFITSNFIKNSPNSAIYLWKKNNSFFQRAQTNLKKNYNKRFFPLPEHRLILKEKSSRLNVIKRNKTRSFISKHLLYILIRLEDKIDFYASNEKTQMLSKELTHLYNFINHLIKEKLDRNISTSLILSNVNDILKIKKNDWKFIYLRAVNNWLKGNISLLNSNNKKKIEKFFDNIWKKIKSTKKVAKLKTRFKKKLPASYPIIYAINWKKNFFGNYIQKKRRRSQKVIRKTFVNEIVKLKDQYIYLNNVKNAFTVITKRKVKIFFINALSLSKYAFNVERDLNDKKKRSPTKFLQNMDRFMINKYKYVAVYIKDLIRVCFIGMFLKKATFMAKFIAFQIAKLPKNRKETSFIRFIIRVVKTFAAEREEILALRIKFRGRVNRWRRTKSIVGERGILPLHTIKNRMEYGTAQAVNKKGAIGIRIWIRYDLTFSSLIKESMLKYFAYSKRLAVKKKFPQVVPFTKNN